MVRPKKKKQAALVTEPLIGIGADGLGHLQRKVGAQKPLVSRRGTHTRTLPEHHDILVSAALEFMEQRLFTCPGSWRACTRGSSPGATRRRASRPSHSPQRLTADAAAAFRAPAENPSVPGLTVWAQTAQQPLARYAHGVVKGIGAARNLREERRSQPPAPAPPATSPPPWTPPQTPAEAAARATALAAATLATEAAIEAVSTAWASAGQGGAGAWAGGASRASDDAPPEGE